MVYQPKLGLCRQPKGLLSYYILSEGGQLIVGGEDLAGSTRLYPLGTARAIAEIIHHIGEKGKI